MKSPEFNEFKTDTFFVNGVQTRDPWGSKKRDDRVPKEIIGPQGIRMAKKITRGPLGVIGILRDSKEGTIRA